MMRTESLLNTSSAGDGEPGHGLSKGHPEPEKASTEFKILPLFIGSSTCACR